MSCLSKEYSSLLNNIFLAQLHNSKDYKNLSNRKIFAQIKKQLAELEQNGLVINVNKKK